jgi:hypothetical protein
MTSADAHPDDLASALLDGKLPPGAADAARRDPAVMARVAAMARARDRVRDVPPPSAEAREQGLAAALAAFDPDAGVAVGRERGEVADLAARRRARAQRTRWLGAAAVVLALVASVAGLAALAGDGQDDSESVALEDSGSGTAGDEAGDDGAAQDAPTEESESSAESAAGAVPAPDVGHLGSFPDAEALAAAARARARSRVVPGSGADADSSFGALSGCPPDSLLDRLGDRTAAVVLQGTAELDGTAVRVWVVAAPDGEQLVAIDGSCRIVVDQPLG